MDPSWCQNAESVRNGCNCDVTVIATNAGDAIGLSERPAEGDCITGAPPESELRELARILSSADVPASSVTLWGKKFIVLVKEESTLVAKSGKSCLSVRKCRTIFFLTAIRNDDHLFGSMREAAEKFANYYAQCNM